MKRFFALILISAIIASCFIMPAGAEDGIKSVNCKVTNLGIPASKVIWIGDGYDYARTVWDMTVYNGKLYIGSGDYNSNSGSHYGRSNIWAYNLSTGKWDSEKMITEEAVNRFRIIDGDLCFVGMDAMHNGQYESYFRYYKDEGKWYTKDVLPDFVMHNFDLIEASDGTVFAGLGTDDGDCNCMAVSYDGGETFENVTFRRNGHALVDADVTDNGRLPKAIYTRTYNVFEYKGDVYATWYCHAESGSGTAGRELCNTLNDTYSGLYVWNKEDKIFDYYSTCPFALMCDSFATGFKAELNGRFLFGKGAIHVFSDDLKSVAYTSGLLGALSCIRSIGGEVYLSTYKTDYETGKYTNIFYSTYDLVNFREICSFEFDSPVASFCIYGGCIYAGTGGQVVQNALPTTGTIFRIETGRFNDVKPGQWYNGAVDYACDTGIMSGTSSVTFEPDGATSRAMLVKVLHNYEGKPVSEAKMPFTDVTDDQWYADSVRWAYENEIVSGTSPTTFSPEDEITREQFATILYRYAQYKNYDVSGKADMSVFKDYSSSSEYARSALSWANACGYITGVDAATLSPRTNATRAQMATILQRFVKNNVSVTYEKSEDMIEDIEKFYNNITYYTGNFYILADEITESDNEIRFSLRYQYSEEEKNHAAESGQVIVDNAVKSTLVVDKKTGFVLPDPGIANGVWYLW